MDNCLCYIINTVYNSAHDANWFKLKIKSLFEKIQFEHIWNNHNSFSKNRLIFSVHRKLKEKFILLWKDRVFQDNNPTPGNQGNKLRTYYMFKKEFEMENFLKIDVERKILSDFVKIRISNSNLLIETGRHKNLALEKRICPLCKAEIENEIAYIFYADVYYFLRPEQFFLIQYLILFLVFQTSLKKKNSSLY